MLQPNFAYWQMITEVCEHGWDDGGMVLSHSNCCGMTVNVRSDKEPHAAWTHTREPC